MTTLTNPGLSAGYEPIPGYRLLEPLGHGGFGEVWRVEAPGGVMKAAKFVYGGLDERRAMRELRSLERIKGVHHPFLLTLDRFEVVEGRLVIITELADGSLEDVYRRHCERGSCGIPRPALLSYLQDAADALDYLNAQFQLQHLDVKPGNLLMVGGHVKVADFGLLKDLRDVESSMVGGLTPIYAPPEVFDGRPCGTSDQYSLAVMYQELLTGTRPFSGRTIAQLAVQHVHSAPNLEPLPPADRPVVARALEKSPQRRYPSCIAFVEALRVAADRGARSRRVGGGGDVADTHEGTSVDAALRSGAAVEDLPRLSTSCGAGISTAVTDHALVVAIGGTGAACLQRLRARLASLHPECPLDLHSVLIDTDARSLESVRAVEASGRVPHCTAIHTPLRTPSEYRAAGASRLTSISRRWLYNVPRSGQTEGLRPLGRLAMVDHGQAIQERLAEVVGHLAVVCTANAPRVYLVGSIGGGTASGMVWDVAYLLRDLLDRGGLPNAEILPLLVSPSLAMDEANPLATADACAALSELHHYLMPGNSYPGDSGAGWPAVPAARSPLVDAYLVAPNAAAATGHGPVEMIADYLWLDATVGRGVLAAARSTAGTDETASNRMTPMMRSLGAVRLRNRRGIDVARTARRIAARTLRGWFGRPSESRQIAPAVAENLAERCGIDLASLQRQAWRPVSEDQSQRWAYLYELRAGCQEYGWSPEELDRMVIDTGFDMDASSQAVDQQWRALIIAVQKELTGRLRQRRCDLTTALGALEHLVESLSAASERYQLARPRREKEVDEAAAALLANARLHSPRELLGRADEPGPALRYAELRMQLVVDTRLSMLLPAVIDGLRLIIQSLGQQTASVAAAIKHLSQAAAEAGDASHDHLRHLTPELRRQVECAEQEIGDSAAPEVLRIPRHPSDASSGEAIAASLTDVARQILERTAQPVGGGRESEAEAGPVEFGSLREALAAIRPAALACGGRQRVLLVVGSDAERDAMAEEIAEHHGGTISTLVVPGAAPTLVHEAQRISVQGLLNRMQDAVGGDVKMLGRLSARADVRWNEPQA